MWAPESRLLVFYGPGTGAQSSIYRLHLSTDRNLAPALLLSSFDPAARGGHTPMLPRNIDVRGFGVWRFVPIDSITEVTRSSWSPGQLNSGIGGFWIGG